MVEMYWSLVFPYNFRARYFLFRSDKYLTSYVRETCSVKCRLFMSDFNQNYIVIPNYIKTLQYQISLKFV
jgi:hypothetical protein